jgi:hypothetical protein
MRSPVGDIFGVTIDLAGSPPGACALRGDLDLVDGQRAGVALLGREVHRAAVGRELRAAVARLVVGQAHGAWPIFITQTSFSATKATLCPSGEITGR